jgi:hypothetical protein
MFIKSTYLISLGLNDVSGRAAVEGLDQRITVFQYRALVD